MLRVLCVENLAVTIEDLYFVDPSPHPGQEGPERGVRMELRLLEPQPHRGTVYASQRIVADKAVWRADFLESVERGPGSKDRMHHHPAMVDNEPGQRVFTKSLTGDPMGWLKSQLSDVIALLDAAGVPDAKTYEPAAEAMRTALPEIVDTASRTLEEVRAGNLAVQP